MQLSTKKYRDSPEKAIIICIFVVHDGVEFCFRRGVELLFYFGKYQVPDPQQ